MDWKGVPCPVRNTVLSGSGAAEGLRVRMSAGDAGSTVPGRQAGAPPLPPATGVGIRRTLNPS